MATTCPLLHLPVQPDKKEKSVVDNEAREKFKIMVAGCWREDAHDEFVTCGLNEYFAERVIFCIKNDRLLALFTNRNNETFEWEWDNIRCRWNYDRPG